MAAHYYAGVDPICLPPDIKKLVLVSSAPHMRRSLLAFRRVLPPDLSIVSSPASSFGTSYEYFYPLRIEYLKLAVYAVVARMDRRNELPYCL
jgi:uncharacterized SAM-binding protein YcdF (DUF218 family)